MGYEITVTNPDNNCYTHNFYISYNHYNNLNEYGFYPYDFNDKTIKDVLIALNISISKFLENNIQPDDEIRNFVNLCNKPNKTEFELNEMSRINNKYYDSTPSVTLGIIMELRDKLEKTSNLKCIWHCE